MSKGKSFFRSKAFVKTATITNVKYQVLFSHFDKIFHGIIFVLFFVVDSLKIRFL